MYPHRTLKRRVKRNAKTRKQNMPSKKIQHHHMLLRLELQHCPAKDDKDKISKLIQNIIDDIQMKSLAAPHVYYVEYPRYNEGLTGIAPIETSHIAFHFWTRPDKKILHCKKSNCLLEFDIYTCGSLTQHNVGRVLHHLTVFGPTYADITILNRNLGLTIDRHIHWSSEQSSMKWPRWLEAVFNGRK
jgi:S-adenosylmethionine/arginine decarboxylase-like enzyme